MNESGGAAHEGLLDIIFAFNTGGKYEQLLDIILTKLMMLTNSDAGTIYILHDEKLHFRIVKNKTLNINKSMDETSNLPPIDLRTSSDENVSAYVAVNKKIVTIDDVYTDKRFNFSGSKKYDAMTGYKTKSMLVLPLMPFNEEEPEVLGVIQLMNAIDEMTDKVVPYSNFANDTVLIAISNIVASVLPNFMYTQEVSNLLNSLVDVTSQAIAERSAYSRAHSQNVSMYCQTFAKFLQSVFPPGNKYHFSESDVEAITLAAHLHDIGKIVTSLEIMDKADRLGSKIHDVRCRFALKMLQLRVKFLERRMTEEEYERECAYVEDALVLIETVNPSGRITDEQLEKVHELSKLTYSLPCGTIVKMLTEEDMDALSIRFGTLTEKERSIMQEHVKVTERLLSKISFPERLKKAPTWAANHHELLDGAGYPKGLSGDDLDIGSRILTITDIYEALISNDRPYKKGFPVEKAMDILCKMADEGKLDKELVTLFCQCIRLL